MVATIFNDRQLQFIKENYVFMTYGKMSELDLFNGLSETQIKNKARALGIKKTRDFNKSYFKNIDSPDKAYWLGFIYADGYVVYNEEISNYEFAIEIHQKDSYLLQKLNESLGNKHKIINRERDISFNGYNYVSKCSSLRVYSKEICRDLISNNISCNKTISSIFPMVKDEKLFCHFVRGFLDGDGCIYNGKSFVVHFTNANDEFLKYLQESFKSISVLSTIYKEKDKKYRLNLSQKDSLKLLELIYTDSENLRLERKYQIYNSYRLSQLEIVG